MIVSDLSPRPVSVPAARATEPRPLTRAECAAWIAEHDEARLGFDTGRGHRSVVVGYAVDADEVLLVLPEYHPATGYVLGSSVTIDVEAALAGGSWESVRVSGVAHPSATAAHPRQETWPPGVVTHAVRVSLTDLEGFVRAA